MKANKLTVDRRRLVCAFFLYHWGAGCKLDVKSIEIERLQKHLVVMVPGESSRHVLSVPMVSNKTIGID